MRWFDGHLDLTYLALHRRDLSKPPEQCGGSLLPATVTFPSLRAGGVAAAISTIFVRRRGPDVQGDYAFDTPDEAFAAAVRQIDLHRQWAERGLIHSEISILKSQISNPPPLRIALAIEGAACLRTLDDLDTFHHAGIRMVSLTWAEGSKWAGGDQIGGDLTDEGRALVRRLDDRGIIHDVSHLSERAFWSLLDCATGPIVASHSNCRALLPGAKHPERHLSDEQIRALAQCGGTVGINLFARFLLPADELQRRRPTAADVVRHLSHMEQLAGRRDFLALGSDMDSGFGPDLLPADVQGPTQLHHLAEALSQAGWSNSEIEHFAWGWDEIRSGSEPRP